MTREQIIALIHEHYDPEPRDWPRHRGWDDGTGEIADKIIAAFQQAGTDTAPSVEKLEELKRSGHDDMQIAMYTRGFREANGSPVEKCPECGLKADTLLHKFCTHRYCPTRSA